MSSKALKNFLNNKLIPEMNASKGESDTSARVQAQSPQAVPAQYFIVEVDVFHKEIEDVFKVVSEKQGINLLYTPIDRRNLWNKYHTGLMKRHNATITTNRGKVLKQHYDNGLLMSMKKKPIPVGAKVYIIGSFDSMKKYKRLSLAKWVIEIIDKKLKLRGKAELGKEDRLGAQSLVTGQQSKKGEDQRGLHHGHGEYGAAASEIAGARAHKVAETYRGKDKGKIDAMVLRWKQATKFKIDHKQMLDNKGNFKKDYFMILSLQSAGDNQVDSKREQDAIDAFRAEAAELAQDPTSTRVRDAIAQVIMSAMTLTTKRVPNVVSFPGVKPRDKIQERSGTSTKGDLDMSEAVKFSTDTSVNAVATKVARQVGTKGAKPKRTTTRGGMGPIQLMALLNDKLPETVMANMGAPALENRTGRFAGSTKVTNVLESGRGQVIQYSYQRNPYQIFEGGPKSDGGNRDPRTLIDLSIREIAQRAMIGRFTTQRV